MCKQQLVWHAFLNVLMARERLDPSPLQMQHYPSTFISSGCWKEVWQWYTVLCKRAYFANFVKATKCKYSKVQMHVDQHSLHRRQIVTILLKMKKIKKKMKREIVCANKNGWPPGSPAVAQVLLSISVGCVEMCFSQNRYDLCRSDFYTVWYDTNRFAVDPNGSKCCN